MSMDWEPQEEFAFEEMDDICQNYHGGVEESMEANEQVAPHKKKQRAQIVTLIIARTPGGIHCEAIEDELGLKHQTASARVSELLKDGVIVVVGRTTTRSGAPARLYEVKRGEAA